MLSLIQGIILWLRGQDQSVSYPTTFTKKKQPEVGSGQLLEGGKKGQSPMELLGCLRKTALSFLEMENKSSALLLHKIFFPDI